MPKIAFCGGSGNGKTTLATSLHTVLGPGFNLLTYSRPTAAARKMGYTSARDIPKDDKIQWDYQVLSLFEQIRAQEKLGENYITDRSTLDFLVFLNYRLPFLMSTPKQQLYEQMALEFCDYDALFFVPSFCDMPEDNGIRLMNDQGPIEEEFRRIFDKFNIPHYTLEGKTPATKLNEVMKILGI